MGGSYRYGYQGEFADDETNETGWNSFEARMYDPVVGRWMAVDPARQFASPYKAMGNSPINSIDPDGRFERRWQAILYSIFSGGKVEYAEDKGEWFVGKKVNYYGDGAGTAYERVFDARVDLNLNINISGGPQLSGYLTSFGGFDLTVASWSLLYNDLIFHTHLVKALIFIINLHPLGKIHVFKTGLV
jgi:RHS repeat-associated protein